MGSEYRSEAGRTCWRGRSGTDARHGTGGRRVEDRSAGRIGRGCVGAGADGAAGTRERGRRRLPPREPGRLRAGPSEAGVPALDGRPRRRAVRAHRGRQRRGLLRHDRGGSRAVERPLRRGQPDRFRRVRGPWCVRAGGCGRHLAAVPRGDRLGSVHAAAAQRAVLLPGAARRGRRGPDRVGTRAFAPQRRARQGLRDPRVPQRLPRPRSGADGRARRHGGRVVRRGRLPQVRAHDGVRPRGHGRGAARSPGAVHRRRARLRERGAVRSGLAAAPVGWLAQGPVLPGEHGQHGPRLPLRSRRVAPARGGRRPEGPGVPLPVASAGVPRGSSRDARAAVHRRQDGRRVRSLLPGVRDLEPGLGRPLPPRGRGSVRHREDPAHDEPHHGAERLLPGGTDVARRSGARRDRAAPGAP